VLNRDRGYVHKPEDFEWLPGAEQAIKLANDQGAFVSVVINQAGIARGFYAECLRITSWLCSIGSTGSSALLAGPFHAGSNITRCDSMKRDPRTRNRMRSASNF